MKEKITSIRIAASCLFLWIFPLPSAVWGEGLEEPPLSIEEAGLESEIAIEAEELLSGFEESVFMDDGTEENVFSSENNNLLDDGSGAGDEVGSGEMIPGWDWEGEETISRAVGVPLFIEVKAEDWVKTGGNYYLARQNAGEGESPYYNLSDGLLTVTTTNALGKSHTGTYLFLEDGRMVTGRKTLSPSVPGQRYAYDSSKLSFFTPRSSAVLYEEYQGKHVTLSPLNSDLGQRRADFWYYDSQTGRFQYFDNDGNRYPIASLNAQYEDRGYFYIDGAFYCLMDSGTPRTGLRAIHGETYYFWPESPIPGQMALGTYVSFPASKGQSRWLYFRGKEEGEERGRAVKHSGYHIATSPEDGARYLLNKNGYSLPDRIFLQAEDGNAYCSGGDGRVLSDTVISVKGELIYLTAQGQRASYQDGWAYLPGLKQYGYFGPESAVLSFPELPEPDDAMNGGDIRIAAATEEGREKALEAVEKILEVLPEGNGDWSLCLYDVTGGCLFSVNNHPMQAASLIKLFIMEGVYRSYDRLCQEHGQDEVDGHLKEMITVSDNDSANTLAIWLGGTRERGLKAVTSYASSHGYADTVMGRYLLSSRENGDNITTAQDVARALWNVYQSALAEGEGGEKGKAALELLKAQTRRHKLPALLPDSATVANKTGELSDVENDAAIIVTESGRTFILVIMSENLQMPYEARMAIQKAGLLFYQQFS